MGAGIFFGYCVISWTIYYVIAEHIVWRYLSRYNHSHCPKEWNLSQYHFIFYTIQTSVWYVEYLMITNTWIYLSLYIRNTVILENKKLVSIFSYQLVNTCDLHLLKCAICSTTPIKMPLIGQFEKYFKVY